MEYAQLEGGLIVRQARFSDAADMEAVQKASFPTLSEEELITTAHFIRHIELFAEGQIVIEHEGRIIGSTSTIRYHYADHPHTFLEISDNLWFGTHEPDGEWLYGMDMGILPEYRGRGLAKHMYRARHELCKNLGLKGQITVGMLNGYDGVRDQYDIHAYFDLVRNRKHFDPTLTVQMNAGFDPISLIEDYLDDPRCGNAGVFLALPLEKEV